MRFVLILVVLATWSAPDTFAQRSDPSGYIFGGGGLMTAVAPDDLSNSYSSDFTLTGSAAFSTGTLVAIRPTFTYGRLSFDSQGFMEENNLDGSNITLTGGGYRALAGSIEALIGFDRPVSAAPYLIAGVGYYQGKISDVTVGSVLGSIDVPGDSGSGVMLSGGVGLRAALGESVGIFGEARVLHTFMDRNHTVVPIAGGLYVTLSQ